MNPPECELSDKLSLVVLYYAQRQEIEQKAKDEERVRNKLAGGNTSVEQGGGEGEGEGEGGGKLRAPLTTMRRVPFRLTAQLNRRKPVAEQNQPALEPVTHSAELVSSI